MSLDVTVLSTDRDLTTTGALKALLLGATATSTALDAHLSNLIRRGSRWAESYVGTPLTVQSYRETVPGFGRRNLMLARTPLRAVSALYESTDTGTAIALASTEIRVENAEAGFLSRDDGWGWTVPSEGDLELRPMTGQEWRPWMADYVAGWTYDGLSTSSANWSTAAGSTSTGRTLPEDIEQAVLLWCVKAHTVPPGVASEQLGDVRVEYNLRSNRKDSEQQWQEHELMLEPYRRVF